MATAVLPEYDDSEGVCAITVEYKRQRKAGVI
jgi:hypothetical protein